MAARKKARTAKAAKASKKASKKKKPAVKKAAARGTAKSKSKSKSKAAKKKTPARKAATKKVTAKKTAKKAVKKSAKKTAKASVRKAPARKAAPVRKKQIVGEGDYAASRSFLKDQSDFVKKNKAAIPEMGKAAEASLDGPEGEALRDAEATAAARSRDTF